MSITFGDYVHETPRKRAMSDGQVWFSGFSLGVNIIVLLVIFLSAAGVVDLGSATAPIAIPSILFSLFTIGFNLKMIRKIKA